MVHNWFCDVSAIRCNKHPYAFDDESLTTVYDLSPLRNQRFYAVLRGLGLYKPAGIPAAINWYNTQKFLRSDFLNGA